MIYTTAFGFTRTPFAREIDSQQLFQAPSLDELHARLHYLVETRSIGLLTGEPGSGKSTALRRLRDALHPDQVKTIYIYDTAVSPLDFVRQIALELGLTPPGSRALIRRAIQIEIQRLVEQRKLTVLLILDEAQALTPETLALLPLLSNFDWDNAPRLAVLLAGQTGLRQKLCMAHLEPVAQRITVRYALRGFDRETTQQYLEHRLRIAGRTSPLFTEPAIEALHQASMGVMRRIDTLAHHALATAATQRATTLEPEHVLQAAEEIRL